MFNRKKNEDPALDGVINDAIVALSPHDDNYVEHVEALKTLYELRNPIPPQFISPDVALTVVANLVGIMIIVGHERAHVVTSKALNFVMKAKYK